MCCIANSAKNSSWQNISALGQPASFCLHSERKTELAYIILNIINRRFGKNVSVPASKTAVVSGRLGNLYILRYRSMGTSRHAAHSLRFVPDVTQDRKAAKHLSVQCTVGQLDPKQLEDVVEDFLP